MPARPGRAGHGGTARAIADALRKAVVDGDLAPGTPLRQDAIARQFSVSAIPVREALRQLESEGWAKVETNKGAAVAPLSADDAREIYEIRAALESLAIGIAIPVHTPASLRHAEALCKAAKAETDPSLYVSRNEAFHLSLYEPAARPRLFDLIRTLHQRGERYLRLKFSLPSFKSESDRDHAALMRAVRQRDVPKAQALVSRHLLDTGELLHRVLRQGEQN
ncbi:GntR family transcriptional regulator [Mycobacterium sp. E1214]|nr:GntR family transcriptional regulator [Mycobacterium sp. E1214]OBH27465.1 GntR family transcriptional regulator [Mycobacterium sp. E1319]